jgi:hypothetical protein
MQLVVVIAVRNAVSAATIIFTAISMIFFFIIVNYQLVSVAGRFRLVLLRLRDEVLHVDELSTHIATQQH